MQKNFHPLRPKTPCLLLAFFFWALASCVESAGTGTDFNYIPDVRLECQLTQALGCNETGKTVYVGWISDLSVDCETYLFQLSSTTFTSSFDASGTTTTAQSGIYMTAFVTQWVNSLGATTTDLQERTYRVCAFIDRNGNGQLDVNDSVGEGQATPGVTSATINDWFNAQF